MRINLNCPFEERNQVKALGARWDPALKVWYVVNPPDLYPFARWLPLDISNFLATAGGDTNRIDLEDKPRKSKPKPKAKTRDIQVPPNSGPTNYNPEFIPQDIHPDDPPW